MRNSPGRIGPSGRQRGAAGHGMRAAPRKRRPGKNGSRPPDCQQLPASSGTFSTNALKVENSPILLHLCGMVPQGKEAANGQVSYNMDPDKAIFHVPNGKEAPKRRNSRYLNPDRGSFLVPRLSEVEAENTRPKKNRCYRACGVIFPNLFFLSCLIIYALLGAALFSAIEGSRENRNAELETFLDKLWIYYENITGTESERKMRFVEMTKTVIQNELEPEWLLSPKDWSFLGSLFFCCTVFTTVGYGDSYPMTRLGKLLCIVYALFGIPLMFLVMTALGDVLASIISKAYFNFKHLQVPHPQLSHIRRHSSRNTNTSTGNQVIPNIVVTNTDLNFNMQNDNETTQKSLVEQQHNIELFEQIVMRQQERGMLCNHFQIERSNSCPELEQSKPYFTRHKSLRDIGKKIEKFDVPILLIVFVVTAYISFGAAILPFWETHMDFETAFYFCFITFTTIGFGDIQLDETSIFLFCSIYIIVGMEIVFIAFKLVQERLFNVYRAIVVSVTRWDVH
ncbi:potassium channel subfamily K member 18 [Dromiciops gliroides]|uniref:potassium channel subfamily K member 18 n=1 Tax=Dromiciops gliroides TaxID=33562 RepID=UPI001CC6540B|nr:potassium channel subfamily K member 18 [Dromiciops gliroides]